MTSENSGPGIVDDGTLWARICLQLVTTGSLDWYITPNFKITFKRGSFFFMWICVLVLAVAMIIVGNQYYDGVHNYWGNIQLYLLTQGTTFLMLAALAPLLILLVCCCEKGAPSHLARITRNVGKLIIGAEIIATLWAFLTGCFGILLTTISGIMLLILSIFCLYNVHKYFCTYFMSYYLYNLSSLGCKEDVFHCQMVPYLFALAFYLVVFGIIALQGLIRMCYWIVNNTD